MGRRVGTPEGWAEPSVTCPLPLLHLTSGFAACGDSSSNRQGERQLGWLIPSPLRGVVLASSAKATEVDHYLDLLDARELADDWTSSSDVEATKPQPDVVEVALEKIGGGEAVLVGDSSTTANPPPAPG